MADPASVVLGVIPLVELFSRAMPQLPISFYICALFGGSQANLEEF